ncbi:MAG: TonB-dependent receptor domain-containing protein, partial [Pyrinomonadaceae bacterium]
KTGAFTDLAAYVRSKYYSVFVQDDWKVRPNLTVNLGLRWEYFSPITSKRDRISNLILGPNGSLTGARVKVGGNLFNPDRNNFGPQIGFAWSPKTVFGHNIEDKAVLRGGFGVGFNRLPGSRLFESRFNPPFLVNPGDLHGTDVRYRVASDLNSFNYPGNPAGQRTFDPATGLPVNGAVNFTATLQDVPNSYAYRYSLGVEYDLGANWVASVGYQGSKARKLPRNVPYQLFVPPSNPNIGSVTLLLTDAYSNFNALLVGGQHRFSKGFLFNTEYRFSKSRDTCSTDNGCTQTYPFDQSTEYGPSDFDATHSFKAFGVWTLPVFRGRHNWAEKLIGGWDLSGIVTSTSGFPWTPVVGGGSCGAVVSGGGVCPLRPIAQIRPATGNTSNSTFLGAGQFPGGGLTYFTPPPSGSFTVPPRPGIGRNSFRGPGYFSTDMTVVKRFGLPSKRVLGEAAGIEIKYNIYNLFNRLNLTSFRANEDNTQIQHPDFGRALHALSGRTSEIQVRFSF